MPINFGPVQSVQLQGNAGGGFRFGGLGNGAGIDYSGGIAVLSALMGMQASGEVTGAVVPSIPGTARGNFSLRMDAAGSLSEYGDAGGGIGRLGAVAYSATGNFTYEGFADGGFRFGGLAEDVSTVENYGFYVDRMPVMMGLSGIEYLFMEDGLALAQEQRGKPTYSLSELVELGTPIIASMAALAQARDQFSFGDRLNFVLHELLSEGFEFNATATAQRTAIERVMDGLILSGAVASHIEAFAAVVAAIAFGDVARHAAMEALVESLGLTADGTDSVKLAEQLVEALLATVAVQGSARFVAIVSDDIRLDDGAASAATLMSMIRDGISFAMHLDIDDGNYSAHVINTESKGITEYGRYPFNSFAKLGGRYFGMTPDGVRELEGSTDDGEPIGARFRLAMTNLGTGNQKRMQAAYLGYTSTGDLRFKAITVDPKSGKKRADYYRLLAQPATDPVPGRIKVGQGLLSVYWGFEVEAIDGAAFAIDLLDLHPIMVNIRVHGQGGGKR